MFSIYSLELIAPIEEVLKHKLRSNAAFIVINTEYVAAPRFVQYAFLQAYKSYAGGKNIANTLSLEWLCKIALTANVSNAVEFTKPALPAICLADVNCFDDVNKTELQAIGKLRLPSKEFLKNAEQSLCKKYGLTVEALAVYKFEDLLIEKAAVENLV